MAYIYLTCEFVCNLWLSSVCPLHPRYRFSLVRGPMSVCVIYLFHIFIGDQLVQFKYNLRKRTPVKQENELSDTETMELFSPVVSEYQPTENRGK